MSTSTAVPNSAEPPPPAQVPPVNAPPSRNDKVNRAGLPLSDYRGLKTTLCPGCGHNSITERIIESFFELGIDPTQVVKLSGIGCSSKSPAYFLSTSHAFNSVHGRMPSVATGAMLGNSSLMALGVSGDGDTASIGIGQFVHLMRRNLPIIYIIEDNGCYGLTKGQFSATSDLGSTQKSGLANELPPIDTCALAIQLGATFVARSFSGDKKQLQAIIKAAAAHRGTSMIDVISPCVTFNDHQGSTKSYDYVREHQQELQTIDFVPFFDEIHLTQKLDPGSVREVMLHDGSKLLLKKIDDDHDPSNRMKALEILNATHEEDHVLTGVFYADTEKPNFLDMLSLTDAPLASLNEDRARPPKEALDEIMASLA